MIIFYEGLPRSGKSLNALKEYLVPMISKGRKVFAYIEGLNHEQIADLSNVTLDRCKELLIPLKREQVLDWYLHIENDAFVILDEIQNFYPNTRKPLTEPQIQAITEHGHRGLDILLMGQVFTDVHKTWTGRTAQRVLFLKRESAGKPDEFSQVIYKPVQKGDKMAWQEARRIKGIPYDKTYFGAYASHTAETDNKDTLIDERANVWNNPILKKWLPLFGVVVVSSIIYLIYMFLGGGLEKSIDAKPQQKKSTIADMQKSAYTTPINPPKPIQTTITPPEPLQTTPKQPEPLPTPEPEKTDLIEELNKLGRPHLSAYIKSAHKQIGIIEWIGQDNKVVERLSFQNIKAMGYIVLLDSDNHIAIITNGIKQHLITGFPTIDVAGHITTARHNLIQEQGL